MSLWKKNTRITKEEIRQVLVNLSQGFTLKKSCELVGRPYQSFLAHLKPYSGMSPEEALLAFDKESADDPSTVR